LSCQPIPASFTPPMQAAQQHFYLVPKSDEDVQAKCHRKLNHARKNAEKYLSCQQPGFAGMGQLDPVTAGIGLVGNLVGGITSIFNAGKQSDALKKQAQIAKQQQKLAVAVTEQQAELAQQQAAVETSKAVRTTEVVALSLLGLTAVGVSIWLISRSRKKA